MLTALPLMVIICTLSGGMDVILIERFITIDVQIMDLTWHQDTILTNSSGWSEYPSIAVSWFKRSYSMDG